MRVLQSLLLVLLLAPALTAQRVPAGFDHVEAVPFARGASGPLLADMYRPAGKGPFPAIVFIHGGGWTSGTRTQMSKIVELLAAHGYVGMAVDYDLSPAVHFPVALYECKEAVRWLRAHSAEYHVNPDRIAAAGSSAGGELAGLLALTNGDPRYEGEGAFKEFSSSVKAAVLYNAVLDLTALPDTSAMVAKYLGAPCSLQKDLCEQASLRVHLSKPSPPLYVGHGNADEIVPYPQFTAFVAAYRAVSPTIVSFTADGGPHTYWIKPQWFQANADATLRFLQRYL